MRIKDLEALAGTPTTGQKLAIDTENGTFQIDYDALANAIISKLGGDPVTIAHGGTGATSAAAARNALGLGNTSGALPVANGGTGATGTSSATTLTPTNADSRITSHNIYLYQWGKVCFLHVRLVCNFSVTNFTPGTNLDLTLPDAPAPVQPVTGASYFGGNMIATRLHQTNLVRYRNTGGTLSGAETEMVTNFVYLTP